MNARSVSRVFAAAVAVFTLIFVGEEVARQAPLFTSLLTPARLGVVASIAKLASQLAGVIFAARCARRYERGNAARRGWTLMSAWLACWLAGQGVLTFYARVLGRDAPVPSVGDVFFTAGYALVLVALFTFVRAYRQSGLAAGSAREDVGIALLACGGFAAIGGWLLWPVATGPTTLAEKLVNVGDPLLDLVTLIPGLVLWRITLGFRGGSVSRPWAALLTGIAFVLASDLAYSDVSAARVEAVGPLVNLFGILGYAFCAYGTWLQYLLVSE